MKTGRTFEIQIVTPLNEQIIIRPPFSIEFTVTRNVNASVNSCELKIYNLGAATRNKLYKDRFVLVDYWGIVIRAGYRKLETVFKGNILESSSQKNGADWVTSISAFDGLYGVQNGFTSMTVSSGTTQANILQSIISDMPNTIKGFLGSPSSGTTERGKVLMGKSSDVLSEETEGQYFIDDETVNVLGDDEVIIRNIITVDSKQLLTTPARRDTYIECSVLFWPQIQAGILCQLSSLERIYNGEYKVIGFTHNVTISQSTAGNATTNFSLFAGSGILQGVS